MVDIQKVREGKKPEPILKLLHLDLLKTPFFWVVVAFSVGF